VGYRPADTDPLEIMIARQRAWRGALLFALVLGIARFLWLGELPQNPLGTSLMFWTPSPKAAAPAPAPAAKADKLAAEQVVQQLRVAPLASGAPRNQYCLPGEKGWDYVCAYSADDPTVVRMKLGVRVDRTAIVEASMPYPFYAPLPAATGLP
jgi:hypothetical protein